MISCVNVLPAQIDYKLVVAKSTDLESFSPGFTSWLCDLLTVRTLGRLLNLVKH